LLLAGAVDEDDELVFLAGLRLASRPGRHLPRFRFTLESLGNDDCLHMFRFTCRDIARLKTLSHVYCVQNGF